MCFAYIFVIIYQLSFFAADVLLDDFLVAENSQFQHDINPPVSPSGRVLMSGSPGSNNANSSPFSTISNPDEMPSSGHLVYVKVVYVCSFSGLDGVVIVIA